MFASESERAAPVSETTGGRIGDVSNRAVFFKTRNTPSDFQHSDQPDCHAPQARKICRYRSVEDSEIQVPSPSPTSVRDKCESSIEGPDYRGPANCRSICASGLRPLENRKILHRSGLAR